jgi:hypothetical protein
LLLLEVAVVVLMLVQVPALAVTETQFQENCLELVLLLKRHLLLFLILHTQSLLVLAPVQLPIRTDRPDQIHL